MLQHLLAPMLMLLHFIVHNLLPAVGKEVSDTVWGSDKHFIWSILRLQEGLLHEDIGVIISCENCVIQCNDLIVLRLSLTSLFCSFMVQFKLPGFNVTHCSNMSEHVGLTGLWRNLFPIRLCMKHLLFSWAPRSCWGIHELAVSYYQTSQNPPPLPLSGGSTLTYS